MTWKSTQDIIDAERDHGIVDKLTGVATGGLTSSTVNSGNATVGLLPNAMGTTVWGTLKGFPQLSGIDASRDVRAVSMRNSSIREISNWPVRTYKIGTVDPTSTAGNRLTHVTPNPFPGTRYRRGGQKPIRGLPLLLITTTLATPAFVLSGIDYVNQAGVAVAGTKVFTAPATNAALGTGMLLELEDGDTGIQDITAVYCSTAASAGALAIYLVEPIAMCSQLLTGHSTELDLVRGARFTPPQINPAAPSAGAFDTELMLFMAGGGSTNTGNAMLKAVEQV